MKPNLTYPVPAATPASGNMSNERDPMRAHPLAELVIRDGLLIHAMPAYPAIEYLTTPPIEIMGKNGLVELPGGEIAFLFRLNHCSDSTWESLCSAELKGVNAEIQGAQLELRCAAADLGRNYTAAKAALERANRGYAKLRADLCERVAQRAAQGAAVPGPAEQRAQKLRDQFEKLEL